MTFDWSGLPCNIYCFTAEHVHNFVDRGNINIIASDNNRNILNFNVNSWEERYLDVLSDAGFVAYVDKSTRLASNACLDHY